MTTTTLVILIVISALLITLEFTTILMNHKPVRKTGMKMITWIASRVSSIVLLTLWVIKLGSSDIMFVTSTYFTLAMMLTGIISVILNTVDARNSILVLQEIKSENNEDCD